MEEQKTIGAEQSVGTKKVQSRTMNILGKVGKFLMFGGWMLLLVAILAILIAVSTCK